MALVNRIHKLMATAMVLLAHSNKMKSYRDIGTHRFVFLLTPVRTLFKYTSKLTVKHVRLTKGWLDTEFLYSVAHDDLWYNFNLHNNVSWNIVHHHSRKMIVRSVVCIFERIFLYSNDFSILPANQSTDDVILCRINMPAWYKC